MVTAAVAVAVLCWLVAVETNDGDVSRVTMGGSLFHGHSIIRCHEHFAHAHSKPTVVHSILEHMLPGVVGNPFFCVVNS